MKTPKYINVFTKYTNSLKPILTKLKTRLGSNPNQKLLALGFIAFFAIIGTYFLLATKAAGPFASIEPEQGSGLTAINDPSASGGAYVQFGSGTTTPLPSGICTGRDANGGVPADKFPGAACTGVLAGIARANSGSISTSSDGQVIQNLNISGSIQVNHHNVRIKNVNITNPGGGAIAIDPSKVGLVIEDCEIDGTGSTRAYEIIAYNNYTLRRCNIHHVGEGPRANGNVVIEDNYIHDFLDFRADGAHQDTIQTTGGNNITIRHNNLEMNIDAGNAVIMVSTDLGSNLLIERNLVYGGGYSVYGGGPGGSIPAPGWTNVTIRDNQFSTVHFQKCGYWGPLVATQNATMSGNIWYDDYGTGNYSTTRQYPNGDGPRKGQPL
jgi:hypothetical protein